MKNTHLLPATAPPRAGGAPADAGFPLPLATRIELFGADALLSSGEWAAMRGVGERTVQRERERGIGAPYTRVTTKRVAYRLGDCLEFLRGRRVGGGEGLAA